MTDRIVIEVTNSNGFRDSDYTRRGYFVAVASGSGYDGGGYKQHDGHWLILSDCETGHLFQEPLHRCKEILPTVAEAPAIDADNIDAFNAIRTHSLQDSEV